MGEVSEVVAFPEIPVDADAIVQYYLDTMEQIGRGETVWCQRNFDSDTGRVLDLFSGGKHLGFIEQDYSDMTCDAYKTPADNSRGEPVILTLLRVRFDEAVKALEDAVK